MATENTRERVQLAPLSEGEFQRIPGIGPGIEHRLHAAGIQTFRHLASLSPDEIYAHLSGLVGMTAERIAHQDWPSKAKHLAEELAAADPDPIPEEPAERQHYASFMVELLQDENYAVRRTRVIHVQNDERDSWASWDAARLDRWITAQAAIAPSPPRDPIELETATVEAVLPVHIADFQLGVNEVFPTGSEQPNRFLCAGEPFEIHLPFETETESTEPPLLYRAVVNTRLPNGQRLRIGEICGQWAPAETGLLIIPVEGLEEGAYRLEASVLVYPQGSAQPETEGLSAISECGRVLVYAREAEATI